MADYDPVFRDNRPKDEVVEEDVETRAELRAREESLYSARGVRADDDSALRREEETAAAIGGGVYLAIIVVAILILALALVIFFL